MRHHKQKASVATGWKGRKSSSSSGDCPGSSGRLRFLNKKPLCLQYNLPTSMAKKLASMKAKRREVETPFLHALVFGLLRVCQWLFSSTQEHLFHFLTEPYHEEETVFSTDSSTSLGQSTPQNPFLRRTRPRSRSLFATQRELSKMHRQLRAFWSTV